MFRLREESKACRRSTPGEGCSDEQFDEFDGAITAERFGFAEEVRQGGAVKMVASVVLAMPAPWMCRILISLRLARKTYVPLDSDDCQTLLAVQ